MNELESRVTIKHLKMVYAISNTASLTKAAEKLNISQPALSNRLQNAESVLGTQLFFRRGRHLTLTNAGKVFLRCANEVLSSIALVETELSTIPDSATQTIRLGMPPHAAYGWIPEAMKTLEREHAGFDLEIISEAGDTPWDSLQSGAVSVAMISSPGKIAGMDSKRFRAIHLFRDEFIALVPKDHPMAKKPFLGAEEFAKETYITNIAVPEKNREYSLFFQPSGCYPDRVVQVGFTGAIPQLVAAGVGCTIVTRWVYDTSPPHAGVKRIPISRSGLFLNWYAVLDRNQPMHGPLASVLDAISGFYPQ